MRYFGRGHTNGDVMVFFPSEKVVHTGDLFVRGSTPFIDYNAGGSLKAWDQTIGAALGGGEFETVIPGHGAVGKKADLAQWRDTLVALRTRAKAACAAGPTGVLDRLKVDELGMKANPNFERGVPALCEEVKN